MYNPQTILDECNQLEHGKARSAGYQAAMRQAKENQDLPNYFFFGYNYLFESIYYLDALGAFLIFPEMLAMIDANPDTPTTTIVNQGYKDSMDRIVWSYKWILMSLPDFYQIPYADCMKFFEDFKKRVTAYGYNLRPYYKELYSFYKRCGNVSAAKETFYKFLKTPRDGNSDCKACEQCDYVAYFLLVEDDLEKANRYAKDLENFTLRCNGGKNNYDSYVTMKGYYIAYYLRHQDFESAKRCLDQVKDKRGDASCDVEHYLYEMYYDAFTDLGKGLKVFKNTWKVWQEERNPSCLFEISMYQAYFFKKLAEGRSRKTVKIVFDNSFPLYREDDTYEIAALQTYYYDLAANLAEKMDARNGSNAYQERLQRMMQEGYVS